MSRPGFLERLSDDGPILAIAHRGGAGAWPENTLPAFENSVELGYRYLETDVHATVDGQLFAFHDDHLGRVSDAHAYIADLTAGELATVDVAGERVPRLEELLLAWPTVRFNIDPKSDAAVEPLARLIDTLGLVDRVCIGAFSDRRIAYFRERFGPDLCTSMGPFEVARLYARSLGVPVGRGFAPCAQIPTSYLGLLDLTSERFLASAHEAGVEVHFWTIDDPTRMTELLDAGVDGIMTDLPAVLRDVLSSRGEWRGQNRPSPADAAAHVDEPASDAAVGPEIALRDTRVEASTDDLF